jgi:hypothetical protein
MSSIVEAKRKSATNAPQFLSHDSTGLLRVMSTKTGKVYQYRGVNTELADKIKYLTRRASGRAWQILKRLEDRGFRINEGFEDVFQPLSKEEVEKRCPKYIVTFKPITSNRNTPRDYVKSRTKHVVVKGVPAYKSRIARLRALNKLGLRDSRLNIPREKNVLVLLQWSHMSSLWRNMVSTNPLSTFRDLLWINLCGRKVEKVMSLGEMLSNTFFRYLIGSLVET